MKCNDLRALSFVSAWLQLAICFIVIISYSIQLAVDEPKVRNERLGTVVFIFLIIIVMAFPFLIILLVGLKQNRMLLVGIFLYAAHSLLAIGIIYMLYDFIMGFVRKEDIDKIFVHLLMGCMFIGLEFLLTTPIHMLHTRRHHNEDKKSSSIREQRPLNRA